MELRRNEFRNNNAVEYGPAVYNHFNTLVETVNNTACGNVVEGKNMRCEGIFVFLSRTSFRCEPFANECVMPSSEPSSAPSLGEVEPSSAPSVLPSLLVSGAPTLVTANQNELKSAIPSGMPSLIPSDLPSLIPSGGPIQNESPSSITSRMPSRIPSDLPSLAPSDMRKGEAKR